MTSAHDEVWRNGFVLTAQHWQHYDRLNARLNGQLVVVQGGHSFASASGTTHRLLGVVDYRRWNLNTDQARLVVHGGRDDGGATWERFPWQGFASHFHECLLGDDLVGVMDSVAITQCATYRVGGDGVSGTSGDSDPYRPNPIRDYRFIEEDDMTPEEHTMLVDIKNELAKFRQGEWKRDQSEIDRDKKRFQETIKQLGREVDFLKKLEVAVGDAATKKQVKARMDEVMVYLKSHPDVTGPDNPADSQMP